MEFLNEMLRHAPPVMAPMLRGATNFLAWPVNFTPTIKALTNWSSERGQVPGKPDMSVVMAPVAHSLTKSEIEAVAAYVSYLK